MRKSVCPQPNMEIVLLLQARTPFARQHMSTSGRPAPYPLKGNPARSIPQHRTQKPSVFLRFLRCEGTQQGVSHSPEECGNPLLRLTRFLHTPDLKNLLFF